MRAINEQFQRPRFTGRLAAALPFLLALLGACSNTVMGEDPGDSAGANSSSGAGGAAGNSGGASGNSGASGAGNSSGASGASGVGGTDIAGGGPTPQCADQTAVTPSSASNSAFRSVQVSGGGASSGRKIRTGCGSNVSTTAGPPTFKSV